MMAPSDPRRRWAPTSPDFVHQTGHDDHRCGTMACVGDCGQGDEECTRAECTEGSYWPAIKAGAALAVVLLALFLAKN